MRSLEQRINKLEKEPAMNGQAYFESLTDDELLVIVGEGEVDGVKLCDLSDSELQAVVDAENDAIAREILRIYREQRKAKAIRVN